MPRDRQRRQAAKIGISQTISRRKQKTHGVERRTTQDSGRHRTRKGKGNPQIQSHQLELHAKMMLGQLANEHFMTQLSSVLSP